MFRCYVDNTGTTKFAETNGSAWTGSGSPIETNSTHNDYIRARIENNGTSWQIKLYDASDTLRYTRPP